MKQLAILLISLLVALPCAAQTSVFDPATGVLDIPCVATFDGSKLVGVYKPYHVRLRKSGDTFAVEHYAPIAYFPECSGYFDTATGVYTDTVNMNDDSYDVKLRRGTNNRFSVETLNRRGPATTSVWVARNGNNTVYLAGAIHLLRASDYPLPRAYDAAYAQASELHFEIDLDEPGETSAGLSQAQIAEQVRDPQGLTLTQVLTPQNVSALSSYMRTEGLSLDAVNSWSTQMLVHALGYREAEFYHGYSADGVDAYIAARAKHDGKAIHGLETTALQTSVMQAMNEGRENELVQNFLSDRASGALVSDFDALLGAWRRGDIGAINRDSVVPLRDRSYADYLLLQANRNAAWLPKIEAMLQTPATEMVVVGVAHMAGEDGLIALLRQRGYSVERY